MSEDFYALLGVDSDASEATILRGYRAKARDHHPDVSDDEDAAERFRRLKRAKSVLTDPEKRREYDRLGHDRYLSRRSERDERPESSVSHRSRRESTHAPDPRAGWPSDVTTYISVGFASIAGGPTPSWQPVDVLDRPAPGSGEVDLRSLFRSGRSTGAANGTTDTGERTPTDCPKCGGRGTFVHELDTGRGRRRRTEGCERCGGTGIAP